jgi:hypothetical protein
MKAYTNIIILLYLTKLNIKPHPTRFLRLKQYFLNNNQEFSLQFQLLFKYLRSQVEKIVFVVIKMKILEEKTTFDIIIKQFGEYNLTAFSNLHNY